MPTPFRTALELALVARLTAAFPGHTIERAARTEVAPAERPRLCIDSGEANADNTQSPGETIWTVQFTVTGFAAPQATDEAAADALSALETALADALNNATLTMPAGPVVSDDVQVTGSARQLVPATESDQPLGDVIVSATARIWRPVGQASFP
jgi:hypothetical protein